MQYLLLIASEYSQVSQAQQLYIDGLQPQQGQHELKKARDAPVEEKPKKVA